MYPPIRLQADYLMPYCSIAVATIDPKYPDFCHSLFAQMQRGSNSFPFYSSLRYGGYTYYICCLVTIMVWYLVVHIEKKNLGTSFLLYSASRGAACINHPLISLDHAPDQLMLEIINGEEY